MGNFKDFKQIARCIKKIDEPDKAVGITHILCEKKIVYHHYLFIITIYNQWYHAYRCDIFFYNFYLIMNAKRWHLSICGNLYNAI